MLTLSQSLLLLINLANLAIGFRVLVKNPRHIINRSFFLFILGCIAWATGVLLLYITGNFYFDKLALSGGLLMAFSISLFARVFPSEDTVPKRFFLIYIPIVLAILCLPFNLFIRGITIDAQGFVSPINGPLFPFYLGIAVAYTITSLYYFWLSYKKSFGKSRIQIFYFGTGIALFMLSVLVFDILLPSAGVYKLNLLGPVASLFFVGMTGYAIVKHQLLDIRGLIQRGASYSILISLIVALYIAILFTADYLSDSAGWITAPVSAVVVTLISLATIPTFEKYFKRVTHKFFFRNPYDFATAIEELSSVLNKNLEFSILMPQLFNSLTNILHPESLDFFHVSTGKQYEAPTTSNVSKISVIETVRVKVTIPILTGEKTIGIFTFGEKLSGEIYSSQDHTLLRTFASQAAVAFEKAELYEELKNYSVLLEERVRDRTKSITELQTNQRQLFDDLSHALQTPVTVLKGAVEILRKDASNKSLKTLDAMSYSVDDLSRLIREILELSRIEAMPAPGAMAQIDLSKLVGDVVEYVQVVCSSSNIRLTRKIQPDIIFEGNAKQIEESITNLLSNAVRYTTGSQRKKIHVTLASSDGTIELLVEDSGVGIAPERLDTIFDRFYRGGETRSSGGGYGLGLAIVKKIVEVHGGTAHAESILGKGTTMILRFPGI